MGWLSSQLHALHLAGSRPAHARFLSALDDPEAAQRERLRTILGTLAPVRQDLRLIGSYEDFQSRVAPSTYPDAAPLIERQRRTGEPCLCPGTDRWQPTSGSTDRRKWIPYPRTFRAELDAAAGAWLVDLSRSFPGAFRGRHYWSLSWLPDELRAEGADTDDLSLLPGWKRWALGKVMAVPGRVCRLRSSEEALFATTAWLAAANDLTLLSVWSPTFALALFRLLAEQRLAIAAVLRAGKWGLALAAPRNPQAARRLQGWDGRLDPGFFQELWPRLSLVSAWDSAGSMHHGKVLAGLLPQASLQGKGLWATEGVVSFPFRDRKPLALTSHFLEFRCLATGRILPAWSLEDGQRLQPLLTTSSGLLRYGLEDEVVVTGRFGRTPCVEFLGRMGGTDLVGEKLDGIAVAGLLTKLGDDHGLRCLTLLAVDSGTPHYCLLAEGPAEVEAGLRQTLEAALQDFHHYRLARELGQLGPAEVLVLQDAAGWLLERSKRKGQAAGEGKVNALEHWDLPEAPRSLLRMGGQRLLLGLAASNEKGPRMPRS